MANTDKNIVITPNVGSASDPQIVFSGASASLGPQNITLRVYSTNNGTLSFEGSAGQLFSITNSFTGTIFSVNDVSGIPSIEVLDSGLVKVAQYSGNVLLGTGTDNATDKLQVNGSITGTVLKSTVATGTAPFTVASTTKVTNLNADLLDDLGTSSSDTSGNSVVTRAGGNFSAGTITASLSGNASTSTKWAASINLTIGSATAKAVDGSASVSWTRNEIIGAPPASGDYFSGTPPIVGTDGVMEIGRYIDFHATDAATSDFDVRLDCTAANAMSFGASTTILLGTANFVDTTTGISKSGDRLTMRSESTDDVANFASYGLYLPKTSQTAGLYVESPIEARAGLRIGSGAANGTITVGATTSSTGDRLVQRDANGDIACRWTNTIRLTTGAEANTGTVVGQWTLVGTSTFQATFADLAEWYDSDEDYEPGTVVVFGGTHEVTISSTVNDHRVAGVVSTNPAFIMNVDRPGPSACIALQGKVPCKVIGQVSKGDLLVTSSVPGVAMTNNDAGPYRVIGKAMENKTTEEQGTIYISVGR